MPALAHVPIRQGTLQLGDKHPTRGRVVGQAQRAIRGAVRRATTLRFRPFITGGIIAETGGRHNLGMGVRPPNPASGGRCSNKS